jgi:DNA repair protein SbcD/Mre11
LNRKILHAADIHLDSPLQKLSSYEHAPVDRIRGASRRALENMVDLAIRESVSLVVIAGDLYDGDWPDQNTGLFFVGQANKLVQAGIPLVVIRGNHDAANLMTSTLPLPKNPDGSAIMMQADRVDMRRLEDIGIVVHGRSFRTRAEKENMAADYPAPFNGMFNVGLLHTSLTGAEGHDHYAPCTPAQLADRNYDYWALGHVHARGEHGLEGSAPVVFSGNIQGRHIRETGPKGCVIVEVCGTHDCTRTFHELDVVRWQMCTLNVSAMQHSDEVIDAFQAWLQKAMALADGRMLVVRVELLGNTSLHHELHRRNHQLKASLQAITVTHGSHQVWLEDLKIHTAPLSSTPVIDMEGPLESLAIIADQFRNDRESVALIEQELRSLMKKLPVEFDPDQMFPFADERWVAQLIESASAEVIGRLQPEGVSP